MNRKICLATHNTHKAEELQALLGDEFEIETLASLGITDEIPETENTLDGNSLLKARAVWEMTQMPVLADDSGLEVDALNGEPGVFSARYAGEHGHHAKNMDLLLKNMEGIENRGAQFRTIITWWDAQGPVQFEGIVRGRILTEKVGDQGFGYDPLFVPEGFDRTFAQMSLEEKNPLSHRGQAIAKWLAYIRPTD